MKYSPYTFKSYSFRWYGLVVIIKINNLLSERQKIASWLQKLMKWHHKESLNSLNSSKSINLIIQFSESRKSNRPLWNFEVFILICSNFRQFLVVVMIMMMVVLPNCLMFIKTNWEKSVLFQKFWKAGIFVIVNN